MRLTATSTWSAVERSPGSGCRPLRRPRLPARRRQRPALVDCGMGTENGMARVLDNVRAAGLDPDRISRLLLTHYHTDHASGASRYRDALGLRVAFSAASESRSRARPCPHLVCGGPGGRLLPRRLHLPGLPGRRRRSSTATSSQVGRLRVRYLSTPGHCAGHGSYLVTGGQGTHLLAGDAIFAGGKLFLQATGDCDLRQSLDSVLQLAELDFDTLLPGHGPVVLSDGPTCRPRSPRSAASPFRRTSTRRSRPSTRSWVPPTSATTSARGVLPLLERGPRPDLGEGAGPARLRRLRGRRAAARHARGRRLRRAVVRLRGGLPAGLGVAGGRRGLGRRPELRQDDGHVLGRQGARIMPARPAGAPDGPPRSHGREHAPLRDPADGRAAPADPGRDPAGRRRPDASTPPRTSRRRPSPRWARGSPSTPRRAAIATLRQRAGREGAAAQRDRRRARARDRHGRRLRRPLHLADVAARPGRRGAPARPGLAQLPGDGHVLGATSVGYPVDLHGGSVDPDAVAALVTPRTKVLLVNSPNNPTGAVYEPAVLSRPGRRC